MNFGSDTILSISPNFVYLLLLSVDTTDELGYLFASTNRIGLVIHGSEWLPLSHCISEATADRVIGTKSNNQYNFKSEFRTRRDKVVDQYFGRQNDPLSQPPLYSTPLGKNTTNITTSPIYLIPVGTKSPKPTSPALPMYLPGDSDPDPSFSDSSKKSNSSNGNDSIKPKKKKRNKKKKRQKNQER